MPDSIKPRERDAIIQSLRAGVVPRVGLRHLQVGRLDEASAAILKDLERIEQGGATVRFIIGRYGAGKSFFLNLARAVALERRFVVAHADITPSDACMAQPARPEPRRRARARVSPPRQARRRVIANVVERWFPTSITTFALPAAPMPMSSRKSKAGSGPARPGQRLHRHVRRTVR